MDNPFDTSNIIILFAWARDIRDAFRGLFYVRSFIGDSSKWPYEKCEKMVSTKEKKLTSDHFVTLETNKKKGLQ